MSPVMIMGLRAAQALFALIMLGLSGYVANWYNMDTLTASPSQINFLIAAPVFSLITIGYLELVPRFAPRLAHPYVSIFLEVFNVLNYFAGFIALAVFLSQLLFCRGSVCGAARADVAFASFSFLLWGATAALMVKSVLKSGLRKQAARAAMQEKAADMA